MNEIEPVPAKALRKHLQAPGTAQDHTDATGADLTRMHGQGNGVRIHRLYFAVVSVLALVLLIAAAAYSTTLM